jgi:hypothetical protein
MVCHTETFQLIYDLEPGSRFLALLKQQLPHSLLQARFD